jgi:hypothetical protein
MCFNFCPTARFLTQLYSVQTLAGKRATAYEPRHTFAKTALPRSLTADFYTLLLKPQSFRYPKGKRGQTKTSYWHNLQIQMLV